MSLHRKSFKTILLSILLGIAVGTLLGELLGVLLPPGIPREVLTLSKSFEPYLVRNLPRTQRLNARLLSTIVHVAVEDRGLYVLKQCSRAVAISQGSREAFSTGSHAQ